MTPTPEAAVWWVRRDLRLADNPALHAAVAAGDRVLPLFVLDPRLLATAGPVRTRWLHAGLRALDADLRVGGGPGLSVREGDPTSLVPQTAAAVGARTVHVSADFGPYGRRRDAAVGAALAERELELVATGSPYAVAPGTLRNQSGSPFQVFSPFHRAWAEHGVHAPAPTLRAESVEWLAAPERLELPDGDPDETAAASEATALADWRRYLGEDPDGVSDYADNHDLPGVDATSRLSIPLRWGQLHPRTILADLGAPERRGSTGAAALARQIAWRDFFADVLFHRPDATHAPIRAQFAAMETEDPDRSADVGDHFSAWKQGRTGFPLVDAGMRQLLAEGYMHNRVRMVVASFLTKDLHIGWWHGADWFMERLRDGDIAQNQMNWQWVAGCGMDAAPYFRIFNPITQGEKFDPDGVYLRRWLPELRDVAAKHLHQPWTDPAGLPAGYPAPIVDHKAERQDALDRYAAIKGS